MDYKIDGDFLPVVTCKLQKGEQIYTESGGMSWMSSGIKMETNTNGGIMKGLGRAFAGESIFMNTYTAEQNDVEIAFASCFPGNILTFDLSNGESIIAQKSTFLCAEKSVNLQTVFRKKLSSGLFGGEGFIMQKISGPGRAFLEIDGNVTKKELAAGEVYKVDTGYLAAMTENVTLDVQMIKGVKNILFGGEGLFITTLTGPGTIWIQSMPVNKLASTLYARMPIQKS